MSSLPREYSVVIYGAGNYYGRLMSHLNHIDNVKIVDVVTTDETIYKVVDGYIIHSIKSVIEKQFDYIIIAAEKWKELYDVCIQIGIDEKKIILSSVFDRAYFNFDKYIRLKNNPPSIIANTCLGGCVYKELGLEHFSPTINMFCMGEDYLKFICDLNKYLTAEMNTYTPAVKSGYTRDCFIPQGKLVDTTWYFNHSVDCCESVNEWNRKRSRVNYDNLFFLMVCYTEEEAIRFDSLELPHKMGFYYKDLGLKNIVYVPEWNDGNTRAHYKYDWMAFINHISTGIFEYPGKINWLSFFCDSKISIRYS